jgi:hypothetical protein
VIWGAELVGVKEAVAEVALEAGKLKVVSGAVDGLGAAAEVGFVATAGSNVGVQDAVPIALPGDKVAAGGGGIGATDPKQKGGNRGWSQKPALNTSAGAAGVSLETGAGSPGCDNKDLLASISRLQFSMEARFDKLLEMLEDQGRRLARLETLALNRQ